MGERCIEVFTCMKYSNLIQNNRNEKYVHQDIATKKISGWIRNERRGNWHVLASACIHSSTKGPEALLPSAQLVLVRIACSLMTHKPNLLINRCNTLSCCFQEVRSNIGMQELIYLIWHGRKQLLNPIAILRVKREPARGSESPAPGGLPGWATTTQLTAAIMSLHELL